MTLAGLGLVFGIGPTSACAEPLLNNNTTPEQRTCVRVRGAAPLTHSIYPVTNGACLPGRAGRQRW